MLHIPENEKLDNPLSILEEIGNNMSPEKATRALILIPKLRKEIERLMPLDSPAYENTFQANIELHERLGDHLVSVCCGDEIYCGNSHDTKLCKGKCRCENYVKHCLKCKKPCECKFEDCDHKWVFPFPEREAFFIPKGERENTNLFDISLIRERIDTKECTDEDKMTMMVQCEKCHHWKEINWTEYSLV